MHPQRRLAAAAATTLAAALVASGCGPAAGTATHRPTPTPTASSGPSGGYTVDPTGQVSCSTGRLPLRHHGPVAFDAALAGVTARFTAVSAGHGWLQFLRHPQLRLTSATGTWTSDVAPAPMSGRHYLASRIVLDRAVAGYLCLVRFRPTDAPLALLAVFAGGAHCCTTLRGFDPATRQQLAYAAGNIDPSLVVADGVPLVLTRDDAFNYAFAAFAFSGAPLRLLQPDGSGGFADVTRQHPAQIRADAAMWWRTFRHAPIGLGVLAAWAADEELLGHDHLVWRRIDRLEARHRLTTPKDSRLPGWPQGKAYVAKLRRFLGAHGYLAG